MRFNFKKVSAIATSVLMVGMTMGVAAAANYPAPFVENNAANVAIVVGSGSGVSMLDGLQASNIQKDLQGRVSGTTGTSSTVSGEAFPLFTSSSKIYIGDAINVVKSIVTDSDLPTTLVDGTFEGDVSAEYTQTITLGSNPRFAFGKYPTSNDDPSLVFNFSTTAATAYIYNATVTFNKAVNLTHPDSEGEDITVFGQKYTIGSATTGTDLVLFKSSQELSLSVGGTDPTSMEVTVEGKTYTIELTGATSTSATIKVTDSAGASEIKEVTEETSKKIKGLDVSVKLASSSEATNSESATIMVGANRLELTDGSEVKVGSDEDSLDNTNVDIVTGGNNWGNVTSFLIQVAAQDSDVDAIKAGQSYTDPVFGTFKIDYSGLNIADDSTSRENIVVKPSGNDKATVKATNHKGKEATIEWYYNISTPAILADSDADDIRVVEQALVNRSEYVALGNQDEGYLLEVKSIKNDSSGFSTDEVKFQDAFDSTKEYDATITSEGVGSLTVGGKTYAITYDFLSSVSSENRQIRINYPDTTVQTEGIIYPTIQTSKGAKLAFYKPVNITLNAWNSTTVVGNISKLKFPDGDGYTDLTLVYNKGSNGTYSTWTINSVNVGVQVNGPADGGNGTDFWSGPLHYHINNTANMTVQVNLVDVAGAEITNPAVVMFEEQDDSSTQTYNAIIVKMGGVGTTTTPVTVNDVDDTWSNDSTTWNEIQMETNDDLYKSIDYFGTEQTLDKSDSDSYTITISYPDVQIYPEVYVGEVGSAITIGTTGTSGGTFNGVVVLDSEVSTQSGKNLIVVGGSCINSAAATLVGGAYCGSAWTEKTGIGSGQFLIQGFATSTLSPGKLAVLVAGYNAADTQNAATYLTKQTVDTSKKYKGTSSTTAELVTETTA